MHIDPDPGQWPTVPTPWLALSAEITPSYLGAIKAALGVRSSQSLVSELLDIQQLNDTIGEVGGSPRSPCNR